MDYVLFGMGYGATLMLLGWALRTFGPERKYSQIDPENTDQRVAQRCWTRFVQGLGGVIAIAGTAMVLITFVVMLINPDDETGSFMALVVWGFLLLSLLIWFWLYLSRFGLTGIWSRTEGYGLGSGSAATLRRSPSPQHAEIAPKPRVHNVAPTIDPVVEPLLDEPPAQTEEIAAVSDDMLVDDPLTDSPADEPSFAETTPETVPDDEPEYDFGDAADTTVPADIGGRAEAIRRLRERQAKTSVSDPGSA